ncbi:MAG: molybdopterin-dependent oxidoreductase [Solidesulfovibrio sp.]|uniref:molybdopterin-dependent oxidoreductase n=1 Tax=Solidesulfovibrio sp. TaxID=2910990 RepID=UPI002B2075BF|nr:molybdopterin-dependent oxidoreductase [Solidesulfovibrio sp.]MEA4858464.1 molybdopterin-dependent oxidoreductase [Solidesulfovibrio sp.]
MAGITRRVFLVFVAGAALCGRFAGEAWARFVSFFPVRAVEVEDFGFDPAKGVVTHDKGPPTPYALVVDGLVARPLRLAYDALAALPQERQVSDFHCVEGWSVADLAWGGLRLKTLADLAGPAPEARYVVFHSLGRTRSRPGGLDHYVECLPLADLLDPDLAYLLALTLAGEPLPIDHGAPLRLVCPFDLAYKGAKYIGRLEFAAAPVDGWWTRANPIYPASAPVAADRLRRPDPRGGRKTS